MSRILILGASGMLGSAMLRLLSDSPADEVWATLRSESVRSFFTPQLAERIKVGVNVDNPDALAKVLDEIKPDVVVNCIGLVKQLAEVEDPLVALPINALFPHRLARLCSMVGARMVHISTDCVFSGSRGAYRESDFTDADDLYGRSKLLGEVEYQHTVTLRTSIIGYEFNRSHGLLGWFLEQENAIKGYRRAIFSGLPTVELARVVRDFVVPNHDLNGIYHVSSEPISKYNLLLLVREVYEKDIEIIPDDHLVIDRSLVSEKFSQATGYKAPAWPELVKYMHDFK
jgi:dTDP-4-dehydrorhamnose reductase